jgi:hypothetical protein
VLLCSRPRGTRPPPPVRLPTDEDDVTVYYRRFLNISNLIYHSQQLSDNERNAAFFYGFHPDDQQPIASRIYTLKPNFPDDKPFDMQDVLAAARRYFSRNRFWRPPQLRLRDGSDNPHNAEAGAALEQWLWPEDYDSWRYHDRPYPEHSHQSYDPPKAQQPVFETKTVRYREPTTKPEDGGELEDIIGRLRGLSARDTAYVVRFCTQRLLELAQDSATPDNPQMASAFTHQTPAIQPGQPPSATFAEQPPAPARQPSTQRAVPSTSPPSDAALYFRRQHRIDGCAFCTQQGHHLRGCPIAREYVESDRATIKNGRLHLPTGQPIPNDGSGRGLKHSIDSWIAANSAPPTYSPLAVSPLNP